MIAVAGAEAVSVCGGPKITVQLGRIDSTYNAKFCWIYLLNFSYFACLNVSLT